VIVALTIFYSLLSVSLFVPVVAGIYLQRVRTLEAGAAIGAGVGTLIAVQLATDGRGVWGWTPTMLGLIVSVAACGAVLLARRTPGLTASA
jgi:SSS family solute:Na+ symporter